MERKLSIGPFSPNSISFNDNAIVSNYFYPKKFHSLKLFKDLPPTWRKFAYDHLLLEQALDLCQACISFWLQRNWANKLLYCWSFPLLLSRKSWSKSYERRLSCDLVDLFKHLELKQQIRSYTPVVPSKTISDSRPKWAQCLPVFGF